ncbi:hypothetical protein KY285_024307 [Solanum tuberosum]|nr:hypothetical protein KY285_024307 [Solanum tuberosum]
MHNVEHKITKICKDPRNSVQSNNEGSQDRWHLVGVDGGFRWSLGFSGQIWSVSPVGALPSPELAARRSLFRAAGGPVSCFRPHQSNGEQKRGARSSPVGTGPRDAFWPAPGCRLVFAAAR